jgi:hypothetical protein
MKEARYNETLDCEQGFSKTGPLLMTTYVGNGFSQHTKNLSTSQCQ